jgi:hypothetical protein
MTKSKYEMLDDDSVTLVGRTVYRIRAMRDFGKIKAGDLGGYIERESNLSHQGTAWIADNAKVFDWAVVSDDAQIRDNAAVYAFAQVSGRALVYGDAEVLDDARVYGDARVGGQSLVGNHSRVGGHQIILGLDPTRASIKPPAPNP